MPWFQIFQDGPEYEARKKRTAFSPPNLCLKQLHDAVPKRLHKKSTLKSLRYLFRHLACTYAFFRLGLLINAFTYTGPSATSFGLIATYFIRYALWILYWGWQGITFAGLWCLGMLFALHSGPCRHLDGNLHIPSAKDTRYARV